MMKALLGTVVILAVSGTVLALTEGESGKKGPGALKITKGKDGRPTIDREELRQQHLKLASGYGAFEEVLVEVMLKLSRSENEADKELADHLKKVVNEAQQRAIVQQYSTGATILAEKKLDKTDDIKWVATSAASLSRDLNNLLDLLRTYPSTEAKYASRVALDAMTKALDKVLIAQKVLHGQLAGSADAKQALQEQAKQNDLTTATGNLANQLTAKGAAKTYPGADKESIAQAKKALLESTEHQNQAAANIKQDKRQEAAKDAAQALTHLEQAKKLLDDVVRQMRDEVLARLVNNLLERSKALRAKQAAVLESTQKLQMTIEKRPAKKADRDDVQTALSLSDDQVHLVQETTKVLEILESEDGKELAGLRTAVAEAREEMKQVRQLLAGVEVGAKTGKLQQTILERLGTMIATLEKTKAGLKAAPPAKAIKVLDDLASRLDAVKRAQLQLSQFLSAYQAAYMDWLLQDLLKE
jgi:hypothetical protein